MSKMEDYSNKRIAKNAIFLFLRSLISIFIALYASRVLLQKLGVDDYGAYFVVGGVVTMFMSLRTFFASSIQRFLNYARGLHNNKQINEIFCTGVEIQFLLSVVFLLLMETAGIIAVMNLKLSPDQMSAAHIVFQLSIFSAIASMLTVPYDALVIANEKMQAFAGFAILESLLRLGIIYLISIGPFSNLVNYAILAFVVSVIMRFVNSAYCSRLFPESKFHLTWNKKLAKEMGSFASWNFLGNTGYSLTHEGINYILNLKGGVAINAARALTYQIINALNNLLGNVNTAFKPQINASAAETDKKIFFKLLTYNAKTSFSFYLMLMVPVVIFSKFAIQLWLGSVPDYVLSFVMSVSLYHLIRTIHVPIDSFFISIGELKYYQISEIVFQVLNIPLAYALLSYGYPFWSVFISMSVMDLLNHISIVSIATIKYSFPLQKFLRRVYVPFIIISLLSVLIVWGAYRLGLNESGNLFLIFIYSLIIELLLALCIAFCVLNQEERSNIRRIVLARVKRN